MLAIRAARLFDGSTVSDRPLVLVDGSTVVDVDTTGAAPPPHAELVDLGDATLLPGLVDAHVHLALNASATPVAHLADVDDEQLLGEMRSAARRALAAGVTTVRDLGDRGYLGVRLRDEVAVDPLVGADVVPAGPPITRPGGHCWFLGGEAEGSAGVRDAVRRHVERGVGVVKVMTTGGELTPGTLAHQASFSVEELRVLADEAHRAGLPITGHAHGRDGIAGCLAAGFDGVEHATFFTETGLEPDLDVIAGLAAAGVTVTATPGGLPGFAPPPRIAAVLPRLRELMGIMLDAGVRVLVSSDAGIAPVKPHDVLPHSVAFATGLGIRPADAMAMVTTRAAAALGLDGRKGRVARGYDADLLAVDGPLDDMSSLTRPIAVWHRGTLVPEVGVKAV